MVWPVVYTLISRSKNDWVLASQSVLVVMAFEKPIVPNNLSACQSLHLLNEQQCLSFAQDCAVPGTH